MSMVTGTPRPAPASRTSATGPEPKRSTPSWAQSASRCPGTGTARSSRSWPQAATPPRRGGRDGVVAVGEGLTTGEIAAFFAETYGQAMSKDTISRIARIGGRGDDRVGEPAARSGPVYPVVFIDEIHVKVRDGQVANKAFYVATGSPPTTASKTSSGSGTVTAARAPNTG